MKKALKIGGIIVGIIVLVCLALMLICPWLITYIGVRAKYPDIDRTLDKFTVVDVPDDFKSIKLGETILKVPVGTEYKQDKVLGERKNTIVYDDKMLAMFTGAEEVTEYYNPWDSYEYSKEDYRHFFETIGEDFPDNTMGLLFFAKNRLNSEMCKGLRGKDIKVYKELAETKQDAYDGETTQIMDGENFTAYVSCAEAFDTELVSVVIFPDEYKNKNYTLMFHPPKDEEILNQIISSIQLAED